jgi:hypothetical protein
METTGLTTTIAACALVLTSYQIWTIRDNAQRQLRAYVLVDNKAINVDQSTNQIGIEIRIKNFGLTPARNISNWVCVAVREFPLTSKLSNYPTENIISRSILVPQGLLFRHGAAFCDDPGLNIRALTTDERAAIKKGQKAIYVYGEIHYDDAFVPGRWTHYRTMTNDDIGMQVGHTADPEEGNDYN